MEIEMQQAKGQLEEWSGGQSGIVTEVRGLRFEIGRGLARLVVLGLEGTPALTKIKETAQVWLDGVCEEFGWTPETVEPKVRTAFAELEKRPEFPTPYSLRNILNRPAEPTRALPTAEEIQARREAEKKAAEEKRAEDAEHRARHAQAPEVETREERVERARAGIKRSFLAIEMAPVSRIFARYKLREGRGA